MPAANTVPAACQGPKLELSQEVRLAVVMYGGVSLACYISGVAQELYNLVRATAEPEDGFGHAEQDLYSTQKVYRKLSQALVRGKPEITAAEGPASSIRTRFRIDILSGSSAGGINAIVLAKGLANDQEIGNLTDLWINKADIDTLLNDQTKDRSGPSSLLDGKQMYKELHDALDGMDGNGRARNESFVSPNVTELDLYITATDMQGLVIPLRLADELVDEKRHKKVFHFVYSAAGGSEPPRNDFLREYNPILAFAVRSTSAFPFAFEPGTPADINQPVSSGTKRDGFWDERWDVFVEEYLELDGSAPAGKPGPRKREDFLHRAFGDGGYLDNKPFSYAIDSLLLRRADVPLERKLLYIEPAPEHLENKPRTQEGVDVIQNIRAGLLTLPRYETIREDLQRVLQRNHLIERVEHFTLGIEEDMEQVHGEKLPDPAKWDNWGPQDLMQMILQKGVTFGGYHRLKVATLMNELAVAFALANNLPRDSDYILALRYLVSAWRELKYVRYRNDSQDTRPTENKLLVDFDLSYRLRRLTFVCGKMDRLSILDADTHNFIRRLLAWHGGSIKEGLGEPALVWLSGAFRGLGKAVDVVKNESGKLDELTSLRLDQAIKDFRERAKELPIQHAELLEQSKALRPEDLLEHYRAALEGTGGTDALKDALGKLKAPLSSFERELKSQRTQSTEFKTQAEDWDRAAEQLPGEKRLGDSEFKDFKDGFRTELQILKQDLQRGLGTLRRLHQDFWASRRHPALRPDSRGDQDRLQFREKVRISGVNADGLIDILQRATEDDRRHTAQNWVEPNRAFDEAMGFLRNCLIRGMFETSRSCNSHLNSFAPPRCIKGPLYQFGCLVARACARHYYDYYDDYDHVLFPILEPDVGEVAKVDVFRISPEESPRESRLPKLAGTALAHFGAFLDSSWRVNDILWGRMDGAQRLLDVLLPGDKNKALHNKLVDEAHQAILNEVLRPRDHDELRHNWLEKLLKDRAGREPGKDPTRGEQEALDRLCRDDKALLDCFRNRYEVDRALDPKQTLRRLARSTRIVGGMLEGLAQRSQVNKRSAAWVARFGRLFWGVVEVAMPQSTWNLITRRLLNLLLLLEFLLLLGGTLLVNRAVQQLALISVALTIAFFVGVKLLSQYMQGQQWFLRVVVFTLVFSVLGLAALGAYHAIEFAGRLSNELGSRVQNLIPRDGPKMIPRHSGTER